MSVKKNIFVIIGSASRNSANEKLIDNLVGLAKDDFDFTIFTDLKSLPHFDPELSTDKPPEKVVQFRSAIEKADGIIICTPEYIFSIPSGLKNAIEWCVSTIIFTDKPTGLITASAGGQAGHAELQMIMKTLMAKFNDETVMLIQGIKGKIDAQGLLSDQQTITDLIKFSNSFKTLVNDSNR